MAKNSPEPATVTAVDARSELQAKLDDTIMQLESRNRSLAAQRKQLDLETQANDDALRVARDGISALDAALVASRQLALVEEQ